MSINEKQQLEQHQEQKEPALTKKLVPPKKEVDKKLQGDKL